MRSTRSTGFRLAMRSGLQSKLVCWAPSGRPTARRRGPRPSSGRRLLWRFAPATLPRNFWMLQPVPLKLGQAFARNEGQSRQPVEYALCHAATLSRTIAALVSGTPNRNLKAAYSLERGVVSVVAVASEMERREVALQSVVQVEGLNACRRRACKRSCIRVRQCCDRYRRGRFLALVPGVGSGPLAVPA